MSISLTNVARKVQLCCCQKVIFVYVLNMRPIKYRRFYARYECAAKYHFNSACVPSNAHEVEANDVIVGNLVRAWTGLRSFVNISIQMFEDGCHSLKKFAW